MFHSARLKLTAYYLLIIMTISFLFSAFIYHQLTSEFERILKIEKARLERQIAMGAFGSFTPGTMVYINPEVIEESKHRILMTLVLVNFGILTLSAAAGYFLAGRTLRPIKEMIDQQDQFITDASHELKTPLTALKTQIEVGLRDKNLSLKESEQMLQSNLEEVNSLQHLSESLMKLSQSSRQLIPFQPIDIKEEIKTAIKKITPLAKNKKIEIELKGQNYFIEGEEGNITELITILLDNAIKYSNPQTKVQIKTYSHDGHAVIEVNDQGIGINPSDLPHLFDRFYRSDKSRTKKDTDGFGLGLSIAKKIVANLNGKIDVKSTEEAGSIFFITLPRLKV